MIIIIQIVAGILWPPPSVEPTATAVIHIFEMFQSNPILTFVRLDGLMLLDYVLLIMVYLALYAALRRSDPSLMMLGTGFAMVGITLYFTANPAPALLALAQQYTAGGSAEGNGVVAAGQAILADFQGAAFLVHYILMGIAGILVSLVMLRSRVFSRPTAVAGILQGAMMLVPVTFGTVGLIFALGSLVPFTVWFVLLALQLLRRAASGTHPSSALG